MSKSFSPKKISNSNLKVMNDNTDEEKKGMYVCMYVCFYARVCVYVCTECMCELMEVCLVVFVYSFEIYALYTWMYISTCMYVAQDFKFMYVCMYVCYVSK